MTERQTARTVLMIRPAAFAPNEQTAESNHFQTVVHASAETVEHAQKEFDSLANALRGAGVEVCAIEDTLPPAKPDAVFPNNWFSTHADGTVVLYPMYAPNRRLERRVDLLAHLTETGFKISRVLDLSDRESRGTYLEGTGSVVLDRSHRLAYACRSPRTSEAAVNEFAAMMGYRAVVFDAADRRGRAVYHTNVILAIGRRFAAVCLECLRKQDRSMLTRELGATGHEIIELTLAQISAFAGNVLELEAADGTCVALSSSALRSLTNSQRNRLEQLGGRLVAADIPTIERNGGGSVRCMLAEIHLPRR